MTAADFPEDVKKFIYDFVDSVSMLEIIILLSQSEREFWTAEALSQEKRSNPNAAANGLRHLKNIGLAQERAGAKGRYYYSPKTPELAATIASLPALYQARPQHMLELIFSPLKQARIISNGFRVSPKKANKGDGNG